MNANVSPSARGELGLVLRGIAALGLSRRPTELPLGVHLYAMCGHGIYGGTLEALTCRSMNAR
jgi:hypothetical protein